MTLELSSAAGATSTTQERLRVITNPREVIALVLTMPLNEQLTRITTERFVLARLQNQTAAGKVLGISQTPAMEIRVRTEISSQEVTVIDALLNTIYVLRGREAAAKLESFNHGGQWFFSSLDNSTGATEAEVYRIPLERLKSMSDAELITRIEDHYAAFQEYANAWPHNEDVVLNDHGRRHLLVVLNKLLELQTFLHLQDPLEKRAQIVAVIFHDIGMAIGGREGHAALSVEALRSGQLVDGWDSSDPFCARVEHLIRFHCTAAVEKKLDIVATDPGLATVILADELDMADRMLPTYLESEARAYIEDPWIRVATHIEATEIEKVVLPNNEVWMLFTIQYDADKLQVIQAENSAQYLHENRNRSPKIDTVRLGMIETLNATIFTKKLALYEACAAAMIGAGTRIGVRFNQDSHFYEVGAAGIQNDRSHRYPKQS